MSPAHPAIPPAAPPIRKTFDPWNSSSTGHQRAENRLSGSTSWRQSRSAKLRNQFAGGPGGGKRILDVVGAGSRDFGQDGRKENGSWEKGAPGRREAGWRDGGMMIVRGSKQELQSQRQDKESSENDYLKPKLGLATEEEDFKKAQEPKRPRRVFQDLSFYINGSTAPMISDHKLKQLIAENGGTVSFGLARRSVTHCVVGRPNGLHVGAGGGLSGGKIQKEIARVRGCGIKFINVEWVLESLKAGKKLPEHQYKGVDIAPKGVKSVAGMFKNQEKKSRAMTAV